MSHVNDIPSDHLLKAFRARLILDGLSISEWSRQDGFKRQNVTKAITGTWQGPNARDMVKLVISVVRDQQ